MNWLVASDEERSCLLSVASIAASQVVVALRSKVMTDQGAPENAI